MTSFIRSESSTLYCGIERVNSCTLLLINPARKKNTIKIKINNKAMAMPCGTLRCVIALITGEQIMAINNANKKGTTISAANLIPANTITKAAIATKVRLKFKFFSTKWLPHFLRLYEHGSRVLHHKQRSSHHRFYLFGKFQRWFQGIAQVNHPARQFPFLL